MKEVGWTNIFDRGQQEPLVCFFIWGCEGSDDFAFVPSPEAKKNTVEIEFEDYVGR